MRLTHALQILCIYITFVSLIQVILYRTYTTASDVWSYGILLYEMWSLGHKPYKDYEATNVRFKVQCMSIYIDVHV